MVRGTQEALFAEPEGGVSEIIGLLIYTFAAFGLAYIVGHSRISYAPRLWIAGLDSPKRRWSWVRGFTITLIECPACFGTWCGAAYGLAFSPPWGPWWMLALYTCGMNFFLGRISRLIDDEEGK